MTFLNDLPYNKNGINASREWIFRSVDNTGLLTGIEQPWPMAGSPVKNWMTKPAAAPSAIFFATEPYKVGSLDSFFFDGSQASLGRDGRPVCLSRIFQVLPILIPAGANR